MTREAEKSLAERFTAIHAEGDLATVSDFLRFTRRIDAALDEGKAFLALHFPENITVSGSFTGCLMARIERIKRLSGRAAIITNNATLLETLYTTGLHTLLPVYCSPEEFARDIAAWVRAH